MGQVVLGVAGAVVGGMVGQPQLGYMLGSALGGALFPEKGTTGPRITDLKIQDSSYGIMIPILFGTYRCAGNLIWGTKLVEHEGETDSGSGGGGTTGYTYTVSFAVGICEGPIVGIARIWADGKLIYSKLANRQGSGVAFNASGYSIYLGDETQTPDPAIEMDKGVGNVPAFRGMAYMVFNDLELGKFGNRIPSLTFEVVTKGTKDGDVINPTDVPLADILTALSYKAGMTSNFAVDGVTNFIHGFGVTSQMPARSAIEPLMVAGFIDAVESDSYVKYVQRGLASVTTIHIDNTLEDDNA